MQSLMKTFWIVIVIVVLGVAGWIVKDNYSWLFAKTVSGQVVDVQHVNSNVAVIDRPGEANDALFSFAVAIRDAHGVIYTASSNDRQFAVVKPGFCADVTFYPFPPWQVTNSGRYSNAKLDQMRDCPPGMAVPPGTTAAALQAPAAGLPPTTPTPGMTPAAN